MKNVWRASSKWKCAKCKTVWDPTWVVGASMDCPFCWAGEEWQHVLPASKKLRKESKILEKCGKSRRQLEMRRCDAL
jgi:hypothetical protein